MKGLNNTVKCQCFPWLTRYLERIACSQTQAMKQPDAIQLLQIKAKAIGEHEAGGSGLRP